MPFPRASQALSRFTVLDLTRVRSGPTCVRQLADWGANVIKIETPPRLEKGEGPGGPRQGPDFQNLHRNKRSMTLDLKSPQGHAALHAHGREGRRGGGEFPPRREGPARHRLRGAAQGQQAHRPRQHLRLRPGRALSRPAGLRPDRAGHGRADVDHRTAGAGPGARRHSGRRSHRRPVLRARHPDRAARARSFRRRASGSRPRCCRRRSSCSTSRPRAGCRRTRWPSRPATIIRPASRPACSRPATATSTSPPPARRSGSASATRIGAPELDRRTPDYQDRRAALEEPRRAQCRDRQPRPSARPARNGSTSSTRPACPAGPIYSIDQVFADPTGQASRHRAKRQAAGRQASRPSSASRSSLSRTPSKIVATPPELGQHTDEVLKEFGFADNEIAALHGQGGLNARRTRRHAMNAPHARPTRCCPARRAASAT